MRGLPPGPHGPEAGGAGPSHLCHSRRLEALCRPFFAQGLLPLPFPPSPSAPLAHLGRAAALPLALMAALCLCLPG